MNGGVQHLHVVDSLLNLVLRELFTEPLDGGDRAIVIDGGTNTQVVHEFHDHSLRDVGEVPAKRIVLVELV